MQKYYFNTIIKYKLIFILFLSISSCNAILENDISEEKVNLILPLNGQNFSTNQIGFKWQLLDGANKYKIEIVSPSYASIQSFVLDTIVEGDSYNYILSPGDYEFKIRGENSAYQSNYIGPYSITVDSVSDLSTQLVQILSPLSNYYTNSALINCSWSNLYAADNYEFQLRSGLDFNNSSSTSHIKTEIYSTSYSIPLVNLQEGKFSWGIKAHNQNSFSNFSTSSFIIDLTNPVDVDLIEPLNDEIAATQTVVFKWNLDNDPGTVHSDVSSAIEISSDINFSSTILYQDNIISDSLEYTFSVAGDYWWRVLANDQAGNQSDSYLEERKITIP